MKRKTIWTVPEFLRPVLARLLDAFYPRSKRGRPRCDLIRMVEAGIHRLRTGCQWCALPREFGAPSTAFTWHQRFCQDGLYLAFWQATLLIARVLATVYLTWLSCDTVFAKAPVKGGTGTGPNPTDRAKQGVKRSLLVDQCGGPLAVIVAPANVHDSKLLENTLSSALVPRCTGAKNRTSHVCLDKC